jgi:NAD(P)-dependent dehydrogenase (short-subunit alcohol dehydrogenase family)
MQQLVGKVALVTGASRGIGAEIARRLGKEGALVAVHYGSSEAAAAKVVADIEETGGRAFAVQAEIGTLEGIQSLFRRLDAELTKRTGTDRLDILVNNAGVAAFATVEETTEEVFDRLFAVNVKGPFFVTQSALSRLKDGGRIVNVSTVATRTATPMLVAYASSKGALDVLTRTLAEAVGPRGITVNTVAPGVVETDMSAGLVNDPNTKGYVVQSTALGRLGQPRDIAGVVAFLVSPEAGWVTGQYLEASGGLKL